MANGKASGDSEDYVLRSGPRFGLKREFAFALKVHSEVSGSLGRTRSRRLQSPPPPLHRPSGDPASKRLKTSAPRTDAVEIERIGSAGSDGDAAVVSNANEAGDLERAVVCDAEKTVVFGESAEDGDARKEVDGDAENMVIDDSAVDGDAKKAEVGDVETVDEHVLVNGDADKVVVVSENAAIGDAEKTVNGYVEEKVGDDVGEAMNGDEEREVLCDVKKAVNGNVDQEATSDAAKMSDGVAEKSGEEPVEKTAIGEQKNVDGVVEMMVDGEKTVDSLREKTEDGLLEMMFDEGKGNDGSSMTAVDDIGGKAVVADAEKVVDGDEGMVGDDTKKMVDGDAVKVSTQTSSASVRRITQAHAGKVVGSNVDSVVDANILKTSPQPPPSTRRVTQLLAEKIEDGDGEKMVNGDVNRMVNENELKTSPPLLGRRVTRSLAEKMEDSNSVKMVDGDPKNMDGMAALSKSSTSPLRTRVTRSVKKEVIEVDMLEVDFPTAKTGVSANLSAQEEKLGGVAEKIDGSLTAASPAALGRRFTRSLLQCSPDPLMKKETAVNEESTVFEAHAKPSSDEDNVKSQLEAANEVDHVDASSKQKLELKMSKKISVTKPPSNFKDLLATGLLEGLPVTYRSNKGPLKGTVSGVGILCFCSDCQGSKVVVPFEFERHARSLNKHPTKYVYFDNGKCVRDILNACRNVPIDMLESVVQSVISSLPDMEYLSFQNSQVLSRPTMVVEESLSNATEESPSTPASNFRIRKKTASSESTSKQPSSQKRSDARLTKKDLRLHKLVFMDDVLPDGTEVGYYVRGKKLLEGYKKGNMIFCCCCNTEVSPSQFEAHAGWASRRKPYLHIYTSNGVSLHELSVSLSRVRKFLAKDNDDLCQICADFGDLLLCDGCPRAFHQDCLGLPTVPRGDWYCKYCEINFEKDKAVAYNANALAAGRVKGIDPIEQISNRCIRIVKLAVVEETVCALCRSHDFSKSGFGPRTVMLCDQCEKEYHVGCLKDHKMADLKKLPEGDWFCCQECNIIHAALQKLVCRGSEKLPDSLSYVIKQKHKEKPSDNSADLDVRWRLLSGKIKSSDTRSILSKAVEIFHDCFAPILDSATSQDLIPSMVYGKHVRDQEFGGMYCAVLIVNSTVVSVGMLRIFGQDVAELPLVATSSENQGKGYFQALFSCMERLLGFLGVKNLLLPAADEAESIWTKKFGFKKISYDEFSGMTRDYHMMPFQGTSMLHKLVPKCRLVTKPTKGS